MSKINLENITLLPRQDTAENWAKSTYILKDGESGYDTDNKVLKIGNGIDLWKDLPDEDDYYGLKNKPKINGVELNGDIDLTDLGFVTMSDEEVNQLFNEIFGG